MQFTTNANEQSTICNDTSEKSMKLPKTHTHMMLTQLNIKDGFKAYGNKGDEAILKEVKQPHT